jgi:hypothetical protein
MALKMPGIIANNDAGLDQQWMSIRQIVAEQGLVQLGPTQARANSQAGGLLEMPNLPIIR